MNELSINEMEAHAAGGVVDGLCVGIGAGSVVYAGGVATNFWNPIGWVSAAFLVADVACLGYAASKL